MTDDLMLQFRALHSWGGPADRLRTATSSFCSELATPYKFKYLPSIDFLRRTGHATRPLANMKHFNQRFVKPATKLGLKVPRRSACVCRVCVAEPPCG